MKQSGALQEQEETPLIIDLAATAGTHSMEFSDADKAANNYDRHHHAESMWAQEEGRMPVPGDRYLC